MERGETSIHARAPAAVARPTGMAVGTALFVLAIALAVLLVPLPRRDRSVVALISIGHVLVGALVVAALRTLLARGSGLSPVGAGSSALLLALLLLGAAQAVRPLLGGGFSREYLIAGAAGAAGATLLWFGRRPDSGWVWIPVLLGLGVLAYGLQAGVMDLLDARGRERELPVLSGFESALEMRRWRFQETEPRRVRAHATQGAWSLEVPLPSGISPELALVWPVRDWRGWDGFAFDVQADGEKPLPLRVQIRDGQSGDDLRSRFEREFLLDPSGGTVEISTTAITEGPDGRRLDLADIASVTIILEGSARARTVHIDDVRLQREPH